MLSPSPLSSSLVWIITSFLLRRREAAASRCGKRRRGEPPKPPSRFGLRFFYEKP